MFCISRNKLMRKVLSFSFSIRNDKAIHFSSLQEHHMNKTFCLWKLNLLCHKIFRLFNYITRSRTSFRLTRTVLFHNPKEFNMKIIVSNCFFFHVALHLFCFITFIQLLSKFGLLLSHIQSLFMVETNNASFCSSLAIQAL